MCGHSKKRWLASKPFLLLPPSQCSSGGAEKGVGENIITVIRRYPANRELAEMIGGNWLNISTKVWDSMSTAEKWGPTSNGYRKQ